jgi:hypothetical protein
VRPARDRRDELYREYLEVPSHLRAEIIGGTLYVLPRPAPRHAEWHAVRIFEGDTTVRAAPFEAVELDLTALWSAPRRG